MDGLSSTTSTCTVQVKEMMSLVDYQPTYMYPNYEASHCKTIFEYHGKPTF